MDYSDKADMMTDAKFAYCENWDNYELDFKASDNTYHQCSMLDEANGKSMRFFMGWFFFTLIIGCIVGVCCIANKLRRMCKKDGKPDAPVVVEKAKAPEQVMEKEAVPVDTDRDLPTDANLATDRPMTKEKPEVVFEEKQKSLEVKEEKVKDVEGM